MATRALTRNGRAAESRDAILAAALAEFAQQGVAGARTDAIAKAAGVNKALLYYYFKDKEGLYGAVVGSVFQKQRETVWPVLESSGTPGERLMRYLASYFDFMAKNPELPGLFQHELMRGGRLRSPHLKRLVMEHFRPVVLKLQQVLTEGIGA